MSTTPASLDFGAWFKAEHPGIRLEGAQAVIALAGEGASVPFIARYRKERTGNLDEVAIRETLKAKEHWDRILARKALILDATLRQKKLTPELREKIEASYDLDVLEDLYLPYKQKKKSRAVAAREAGLEPLADWIWNCGHGTEAPQPGQTLELWAFTFRNPGRDVPDAEAAIRGAEDILVERLAENVDLRAHLRATLWSRGFLHSQKTDKAKPHSKYENYFDHREKVKALRDPSQSHRYLAMRRGAAEGELALSLGGALGEDLEAAFLRSYEECALRVPESPGADVLRRAARRAFKEHVFPSLDNEVHRTLKDASDEVAIKVFAENVRRVLLAAPFGPKAVLGVDPGQRTGCKLAAVDAAGGFLNSGVIYLQSDEAKAKARTDVVEAVKVSEAKAVAVGNGTAGRETELFVRQALKDEGVDVPVVLVNEAGASVYSASELAREELPHQDVTVRGAVSIARRLQDPLAELVKIEPKSIGVGQYQHDVSERALVRSLEGVVESCVNQVGVNLNTASAPLLAQVSGIGPALAKAIVDHRREQGLFKSRAGLMDVARFSTKSFEQAAGFLRVPGAEHPLDDTGVHPERYPLLEGLAARLGKGVAELLGPGAQQVREATDLRDAIGAFTFDDVVAELEKPGRDPRETFVPFAFRDDVHELKDLKPGLVCPGVVTNVTNFGAFVDVGVHQDGLVHVSQMGERGGKDPQKAVSPGDRVTVRVLKVDLDKKQISLSFRLASSERRRPVRPKAPPRPREGKAGRPKRPDSPRPPSAKTPPGVPTASPAAPKAMPPRPSSPSPRRPERPRPSGGPPGPRRQAPPAEPPRAKPAFNNPFAVLASLKDDPKKR